MNTQVISPRGKRYLISTIRQAIGWETAVYPNTRTNDGDYGDCPNCRRKFFSKEEATKGHWQIAAEIGKGSIVPVFSPNDQYRKLAKKTRVRK